MESKKRKTRRDRVKKALRQSVLSLGPEADRQSLTEARLMNDLEKVKKRVYKKTYDKPH